MLSDDVKKIPFTSTRKRPKLLVESLTLGYDTMGNSLRCSCIWLLTCIPTTFVGRADSTSVPTTFVGITIPTKLVGMVYFDKLCIINTKITAQTFSWENIIDQIAWVYFNSWFGLASHVFNTLLTFLVQFMQVCT